MEKIIKNISEIQQMIYKLYRSGDQKITQEEYNKIQVRLAMAKASLKLIKEIYEEWI